MANTIITKNSSTASAVPTAGDLVQGELAVNVTDKRLFTEDAGGNIVEIGTNPSTINIDAGTIDGTAIGGTTPTTGAFTTLSASTSVTSPSGLFTNLSASGSVTLSGGTANGVPYLNGSKVLTSGSALTFDGVTNKLGFQNAAASGYAYIQNAGAGTNVDLAFLQNATEAMRLTSTGLGIGTSSFTWLASGSETGVNIKSSGGNAAGINVSSSNANNTRMEMFAAYSLNQGGFYLKGDSAFPPMVFGQVSGSTYRDSMLLDSSGNVGIGTSSPGDKIELGGNGSGIIIRSPNGTRYRLTVTDLGVLSIAAA